MHTELKRLASFQVFGRTMENVRKHTDIKLVATEKRRNYLVSEPNYHITKFFTENLLAIEMRKTRILMNKPAYLGLSILELNKIVTYEFWYDYIKSKYKEKTKLCYMDTDTFIIYAETENVYTDIAKDVESRFNASNYELDRPLPKGRNKNVVGLLKDELGRKFMKKFVGLRAKTCNSDGSEDKKAKGTKKCAIKRKLKFKDYKNCLKSTQLKNSINQLEKSKVNTESLTENHSEFTKKQ